MSARLFCFSLLLVATPTAQADIYKFVDENGRITYTNEPRKGAKKLDVIVETKKPHPKASGKSSAPRSNPGPSSFPKVDNQTQKKRDDMRRQILEDEMAAEQKALADAQKALNDGEVARLPDEAYNPAKRQQRLTRLRDNVTLHEKNIHALKRELGEAK